MPSFQETIREALELRALIEDFRSATYTVVKFEDPSGPSYMFIASFNLDSMAFDFNLTDASYIEIKGFAGVSPIVLAEYGAFISSMLEYTNGGEFPNFNKVEQAGDVQDPFSNMRDGLSSDSDIDDSEATLK